MHALPPIYTITFSKSLNEASFPEQREADVAPSRGNTGILVQGLHVICSVSARHLLLSLCELDINVSDTST